MIQRFLFLYISYLEEITSTRAMISRFSEMISPLNVKTSDCSTLSDSDALALSVYTQIIEQEVDPVGSYISGNSPLGCVSKRQHRCLNNIPKLYRLNIVARPRTEIDR